MADQPTCKQLGEAVEAAFLAKACNLNFPVAKPWGDSQRYDFVLDSAHGLWRVQVKSTTCRWGRAYRLCLAGRYPGYTESEVDFVAVYVAPEELWYVMPIDAVASLGTMVLRPHGTGRSKYERYREAWCLFTCPRMARGWQDIPVRCRCPQLPVRCAVCPNRPAAPSPLS